MEEGEGIELTVNDVTIKLPEKFKHLSVKEIPIDPPKVKPFTIIRIIVNFKLFHIVDDEEKIETKFVPPFELHVPYTADDWRQASERESTLQLADWDGNNWIRFTERDHDFKLFGNETGGYGRVLITEWEDPPVAWGT